MIDLLSDLGFSNEGRGFGWTDIKAWIELTNQELNAWEVETIHDLSAVHAEACHMYSPNDAPPPEGLLITQTPEYQKVLQERVNRNFMMLAGR